MLESSLKVSLEQRKYLALFNFEHYIGARATQFVDFIGHYSPIPFSLRLHEFVGLIAGDNFDQSKFLCSLPSRQYVELGELFRVNRDLTTSAKRFQGDLSEASIDGIVKGFIDLMNVQACVFPVLFCFS